MDVFNQYIDQTQRLLGARTAAGLAVQRPWPAAEKNPFLMSRDTAVELGGHPKESVNLLLSSSGLQLPEEGSLAAVGDPGILAGGTPHCSFGKVVFLRCKEVTAEETYDYLKNVEFVDYRLHLKDVMVRTSSQQFFTNLRVGLRAMAGGFSLERLGSALLHRYLALPQVERVKIVFILGDSPLYKELLPIAQRVKEVTVAMNTMFEGMEFNCKSCSLNSICAEVDGLREMHAAARNRA